MYMRQGQSQQDGILGMLLTGSLLELRNDPHRRLNWAPCTKSLQGTGDREKHKVARTLTSSASMQGARCGLANQSPQFVQGWILDCLTEPVWIASLLG